MEFNMEPSTFYYVLGTIPQVLAAMAAIIGVFTIFRIENYKRYLIGDGKSAIERWGNPGYKFNELAEDAKQRDRMRDAVGRENIAEIKKVLELLSKQEQNEGYTLKTRPAGLQFLYNERFCKTENEMNTLKKRTIFVAKISIITIIISIISLSCTDIIFSFKYPLLRYGVLWMNVLLLIISVVAALNLISRSFSMSVPHETNIRS